MRLTIGELQDLGKKHNSHIVNAFSNISNSGKEIDLSNVITEFKNIKVDLSPIKTTVSDLVDRTLKEAPTYNNIKNINLDPKYFSSLAAKYLLDIDNAISSSQDYKSTVNNLKAVEQKVIADKVNDNDYNLLVGAIEIGLNSADLWYNQYATLAAKKKVTSQSIARADVAASSAYFVGIGVFALFGLATPVTAVAVLGGWAISAGLGSAYHAIGLE